MGTSTDSYADADEVERLEDALVAACEHAKQLMEAPRSETRQSKKTSTWLAAAFEDMCQALPDSVSSRLHSDIDAIHEILSSRSATRESWIAPATKLPFQGELIVFKVASGAVFIGCYSTIRDYPKFVREDGHGDYTPKAVTGWMELPK